MDIRSLPIGPEEAFVLSRIDGMSSEEDIVAATGLNAGLVQRIIERLVELGAIEFESQRVVRSVERRTQPAYSGSGSFRVGPALEVKQTGPSQHPGAIDGNAAYPQASSVSAEYSHLRDSQAPVPSGEFALTRRILRAPASDPGPVADSEVRRRALARKLGHSSAPPSKSLSGGPPSDSESSAPPRRPSRPFEVAALAQQQQVEHYRSLAAQAAESNNLMSAVNSLKVACSLDPGNRELARELEEMQLRAAERLWQDYAERADYEVFEGRLADAMRSYELAALGHPTWRFFERAAFCCLNSGGDLKKAADLAKRAVSMAPENPKCRLTLAQVYVAAKLKQSAITELERVLALDPKQDSIRDYLRSVKRNEI